MPRLRLWLKRLGVFVLLALALRGSITLFPQIKWRLRVITLSIPQRSWGQIAGDVLPARFRLHLECATEVTAGQRDTAPCAVRWDTAVGPLWGTERDGDVLLFLIQEEVVDRIYDQPPVAVRPGDIVLDLGSHLGVFTRFALRRGAKLVVAFEPDPTNLTCFKKTFAEEIALGRVVLEEAAVWNAPGTLRLRRGEDRESGAGTVVASGTSSADRPEGHGVIVRATTIDETVSRLKLPSVDFIKMDIEGAERNAVEGGQKTLFRFAPRMVICIYHRPDDPEVIIQLVRKTRADYSMFFRGLGQVYFHR